MKNSIISLVIISLLLMTTNSCSKSNSSSSGGKYSWSCEVNGKSYSWSGNYPDGTNPSSMGLSTFSETFLMLSLPVQQGKLPFSFSVNFGSTPAAGTYTFNQSNTSPESCLMVIENANSLSGVSGASMKVTISAIPSNTYLNTQGANPGSIKGTFNGTMYGPDPNNVRGPLIRYEITNGKYESVVLN
jgi:hypothetical protein